MSESHKIFRTRLLHSILCGGLFFAAGKYKSHTSGHKSKDRQIAQGCYEQERAK